MNNVTTPLLVEERVTLYRGTMVNFCFTQSAKQTAAKRELKRGKRNFGLNRCALTYLLRRK